MTMLVFFILSSLSFSETRNSIWIMARYPNSKSIKKVYCTYSREM